MRTTEVVQVGALTLYRGDSRDIAPTLAGVHALIADPPYGTNFQHTRRRRGKTPLKSLPHLQDHRPLWIEDMVGDEHPFDPTPWLQYPQVILWGAQHYARYLPNSPAWLVWDKRAGHREDHFASAELAWTNLSGTTRLFSLLWRGICRAGEDNVTNGPKLHPAQKPIELMTWCVQQTRGLVLDPYAGSFTTGLACLRLGRPYIGIEIEPRYFAVGVQRLTEAHRQLQCADFRNSVFAETGLRNTVPRRGRPRLFPTNAARQAAWRQRQRASATAGD